MDPIWKLQCKNCGAAMGYDIEAQTYRCPHCGELSGVQDVHTTHAQWRQLQTENRRRRESIRQVSNCPNCGASILFAEGEESARCDFCGSSLVRGEFELSEDFPDFVVPFILTQEEAEQRLRGWAEAAENRNTAAAARIRQQGARLTGYYLPYKVIRGPVQGTVTRQHAWRRYQCRGFLEGALVSTCRQLENSVLDAVEPFDLSEMKPFEHGYIAGHRVRLSDLSPAKTVRRTTKEAEEAFRPDAERAMHTTGIRIHLQAGELMELPLLLPVYVLKARDLLAVVNGQTGRVAVQAEEEIPESNLWKLEPAAIALLLTLVFGWYMRFYLPAMLMFLAIVAPILYLGYKNGRYVRTGTLIRQGKHVKAQREEGVLLISEGKNILKNPLSNMPVFTETVGGTEIPVRIAFYSPGRILGIGIRACAMIFLPLILAAMFAPIRQIPWEQLKPQNGAAWYVLMSAVMLLYWIIGARQEIYNHPLIYRLEKGKKGRLIGTRADRRISILEGLFLRGDRRLRWSELEADERKQMGFAIAFVLFILLGCTFAIML